MKKLFIFVLSFMMILSLNPVYALNKYNETSTLDSDNVYISVSGKYTSPSKSTILKRINEIRYEACKNGYKNPSTGKKLTLSDYVAIKWSSDLEYIARLRAAEATVLMSHIRPNGTLCFSATHDNVSSWAENLAWNYSGMMAGIEQWYEEKSDYVNGNTNAVTGHYTSLINPEYTYIALGTFEDTKNDVWMTTSAEFGYGSGLNEDKLTLNETVNQYIEVPYDDIKDSIKLNSSSSISKGSSKQFSLSVTYENFSGTYTIPNEYITWQSSDTNIATVENGKVTGCSYGTTTIKATYQDKTYSATVTVKKDITQVKVSSISNKTYTGKQQKPKVTVKYGNTTLKLNKDYKISYGKNKSVGKGSITITGIGSYSGSKKVTFNIIPKSTSISKLTGKSKALKVSWKRNKAVTGYQIQYSTSSKMKNSKTVTISSNKTVSKTISKLSKKKKYYVRIRTYKKVSKTKYYSNWSKVKSVKTK